MRFFAPIFSLLAAVAVAQTSCSQNCILIPNVGLQVSAGETITLSISNPSPASSGITIKLQTDLSNITPDSGITLATDVDPTQGTVTIKIPADLPASSQYVFETIDNANPNIINFSTPFSVTGATGTSSVASSTGTSSASHSTNSSSASSASSSSASASSSSASSSSATSASRTSSEASTRTSSSATSTATTSAPNSNTNAASNLKVEGALVVMIAGALALF